MAIISNFTKYHTLLQKSLTCKKLFYRMADNKVSPLHCEHFNNNNKLMITTNNKYINNNV